MKRYWSADIHFGHANILKYCNRPSLRKTDLDEKGDWVSSEVAVAAADRADKFNINNFNGRIKPEDQVIHVGDFINYGLVKGVMGLKNKPSHYLDQLNGTWTLVEGNHDKNNGVKPQARHLITEISHKRVFVTHYPTDSDIHDPTLIDYVHRHCDFAIVGHVHEKWGHQWVTVRGKKDPFLNINVGVDMHRFYPISDDEVYGIYLKLKRQLKEGV